MWFIHKGGAGGQQNRKKRSKVQQKSLCPQSFQSTTRMSVQWKIVRKTRENVIRSESCIKNVFHLGIISRNYGSLETLDSTYL